MEQELPINPVDELLPAIAAAVSEWKIKNTADTIKHSVTKMLNKSSEEVVMKLLGFNNRWDSGYELDHCNGRSGNSAAGDFIRSANELAVKEWLAQVAMPTLDTKTKNRLLKAANHEYEDHLLRQVREAVRKRADADATLIINEISNSTHVDKYIKTMKLISSTGEI